MTASRRQIQFRNRLRSPCTPICPLSRGSLNTPPPAVEPFEALETGPPVLALGAIAIVGVAIWRFLPVRGANTGPNSGADTDLTAQLAPPVSVQTIAPAQAPAGPVAVATVDQLSAPWASKTFTFVNPKTQETVPAMVIHLPGAASRSDAYWAFSLNTPYQTCELEFVTSISQLASKYGFRASHPMVVSGCDGTVYDPLQVGSVPGGAFVRGLVVQGSSIRPPIAIDIRVEGRSVIADGIE